MKKIKFKTVELHDAYMVLSAAKFTKLSDADKIKVWKIARALKPISQKYEDDNKSAAETLKPKDCDFDATFAKVQEFERLMRSGGDISKSPIGAAEYNAFINDVWKPYNKLVADAIKPIGEAEVEVEIDPLSEEAFGMLMASNDNWVMATVVALAEIMTD